MNNPSTDLYELISGLNLSEKRYCTRYLQKHSTSKENRYLKLFNILRSQLLYDGEEAIISLGYQSKPNHYAVLKKQLYEQLLDALYQFDLFSSIEAQLQRGIHQCHLLMQRGLLDQCEKRIKTYRKMALKTNHLPAQIQLQQLSLSLIGRRYYRHTKSEDLEEWHTKSQTIIQAMNTEVKYGYLSSMVYQMQYVSGAKGRQLANKMERIVSAEEFVEEKNAITLNSKLDFLRVNALYHFIKGETALAAEFNQRFLAVLDEEALLKQLHADQYFSVLNNYLIDLLVLKKYKEFEEGLTKLRALPKLQAFNKLANFEVNVFRLGYLLEINYMISRGEFAHAYLKIEDIMQGLEKYKGKIVKHNRITLQYLVAYVCFAIGKYKETLKYLQPILQERESAVAEDLQLAARMTQLLSYFEMGDTLILDSLIRSVRRSFPDKKKGHELQRLVLSFINSTIQGQTANKKKWIKLKDNLEKVLAEGKGADALNLFNYQVWVNAHIEGISFPAKWLEGL